MKRKIELCILTVLMVLMLTACGCNHVWQEATCDTPKTCTSCGETEGTPLDHNWDSSLCTPVCMLCGLEDTALASHAWIDATCSAPKVCALCSATEGQPLGHIWIDATCSAPRQCTVCGHTEGEPIGHSLTDGSDGITGLCSGCGKALEYFSVDACTIYDVAPDGSYENPVTILQGTGKEFTIQWVKDGVVQNWCSQNLVNGSPYVNAYYVDGKVYYYDTGASGETTAKRLVNVARKYVNAAYYNYAEGSFITMTGSDFMDVQGEAAAAVDAYGKQYVIVNKFAGWGAPYDPANTYVVQSNWK